MNAGKALIVAAIDFGTTYSGWAFSFKHEYEINPIKVSTNTWRGSQLTSLKGPTCILIKPDGRTIERFGFEAEKRYSELCAEEKHTQYYYFHRFKMMLWDKGGMSSDLTIDTKIKDAGGKEMQALLVFSLSIRFLKDELFRFSNIQLGSGTMQEEDFHWVLTVPAIWNDKAKHFMRLAAVQSGIKDEHLSIALEPEAASLYCKHLPVNKLTLAAQQLSSFREGSTYLVLDAGGGTVDITIHEVCPGGGLREVDKASGGAWGGTKVDEAFLNLLEELTGKDVIRRLQDEYLEDYLELMRDFEINKRGIELEGQRLVTIRVPKQLCDLVLEMKLNELKSIIQMSRLSGEMEMKADKLRVHSGLFRSLFDNSITSIVEHVEGLLAKPQNRAVEAILMVGGYSESPLLQETIKRKFSSLKVIVPAEAGLAVLIGAVIFGHEPIVIRERVAKFTYGTDFVGNIFEFILTGGKQRFSKLVTNGQRLVVGTPQQENTYCPISDDQTFLPMDIYVTHDTDPIFVNDPGCEKIGTFKVPISGSGTDRQVTVKMIFGGTEMEVVCTESKTGKETHMRVDFLH